MIKHIVFDLSEVLIPGLIGVEDKLEEKTHISKNNIAKALGSYPYYVKGNILDQLLKGELSYSDYRSLFLSEIGLSVEHEQLFDSTCLSMFDSAYDYTNDLLKELSKNFNLYLLSDHCMIWVPYILERHKFLSLFKGLMWSYEIGETKKSIKPFEEAIKKFQLSPEDSLFIDDNKDNIKNARSLGFNTVLFKGKKSIEEIYRTLQDD